mmetsp:Transcript_23538/g.59402  ORF Transcript_23538/g.59402 Transcript_23538/m.59402 type:complete len:227 (-) Transcript_23538:47-727(-)
MGKRSNEWGRNLHISMYELGRIYKYGLGGRTLDTQKAESLFSKSAAKKFAPAMTELARSYELKGGKKNEVIYQLYYESAAQGWPDAVFHLAECYKMGIGVERNEDLAITLYSHAALITSVRSSSIGALPAAGSFIPSTGFRAFKPLSVKLPRYMKGESLETAFQQQKIALQELRDQVEKAAEQFKKMNSFWGWITTSWSDKSDFDPLAIGYSQQDDLMTGLQQGKF